MIGFGFILNEALYQYQKDEEEKAYRYYMAECGRLTAENTAMVTGRGKYLRYSFVQLFEGNKRVDNRTEAEIKAGIYSKLQEIGKEGD